jgi:surfactin synthase thioesterase subunit
MGAWVAWEMLQELTRRGLPLPVKLFVSGNRAPSLCGAAHDVDAGVAMHQLPSAEFWARFEQRYGHNATLVGGAACVGWVSLRELGVGADWLRVRV